MGAALNAVLTDGEELFPTGVVLVALVPPVLHPTGEELDRSGRLVVLVALVPPVLHLLAVGRISSFELPGVKVVARQLPTTAIPPDDGMGLEADAGPEWATSPEETGRREAVTVVVGREYAPETIADAVADERVKTDWSAS